MQRDVYTEVTARILNELKSGAAPWVKPWATTPGANRPVNAAAGRHYNGGNVVLLWMATAAKGWTSARFVTFNQAKALGGHVNVGEKGTQIVLVKTVTKQDKQNPEDIKKFGLLRYFTVFNVEQCSGLPEKVVAPEAPVVRQPHEQIVEVEQFLTATKAKIEVVGERACYTPSIDTIRMPSLSTFKTADHYYATTFHELGHWTGAKSRLDRTDGMRNRFGDQAYAAEELVAELTSAFICAEFDINGDLRHAGYIQNWIELLTADPKAFFTAASKAQAAADHLRGLALAGDDEQELAA